jgi:nickel-dependent lactate racemase
MEFSLQYTLERVLTGKLPDGVLIEGKKEDDPEAYYRSLAEALNAPEKAVDFFRIAEKARSIVFIVEDHTRHSPILETLEYISEQFTQLGISWNKVKLLIATGTHRPMLPEEMESKFGKFVKNTEITQHDAYAHDGMKGYGTFLDIPIFINREVEADMVVGIGAIVPHRFSGWSGGAKLVCPGISSYETVYLSHRMAIMDSDVNVGAVDNKFRMLIDEVGKRVSLDYIINYYYKGDGSLGGCVCGHPIAAHRKGVLLGKKLLSIGFPQKSDITLISSFPSTTDLWQSGKALYTADLITKSGGVIIMVSPLTEGFGDHPLFASLLRYPSIRIIQELDGENAGDPLAYVAAYAVQKVMESKRVIIVSETAFSSDFEKLGLKVFSDLQEGIKSVFTVGKRVIALKNSFLLPEENRR